jgi:hypothetical protein
MKKDTIGIRVPAELKSALTQIAKTEGRMRNPFEVVCDPRRNGLLKDTAAHALNPYG